MKDQLLKLQQLQVIDSRISEFEVAIRALPESLKPAKQDLAKLEAMLDAEKNQLSEAENWRNEQRAQIKQAEEDIKKAKIKLQASKNNREFAAASREMDNKRRSIAEREDEIRKVTQAIESTSASIESHGGDVATLRSKVEAEESEIGSKVAALEKGAKEASAGRDDLVAALDPKILKKYQKVRKAKVVAVVAVKEGVCQGCHMSLPPQLNNILAGFDTIELCPQCRRIVYRSELIETDEDSQENEAQAEDQAS